ALIGLRIKLDRPGDRGRPCCRNVCTIGAGRGPHAGELICSDCGQHRGWLSKSTAHWIETVVTRFGAPTTPIVVRKQEEVPPTDPQTRTRARTSTSTCERTIVMKASDAFPSRYLQTSVVKGKPIVATISHVEMETVGQGADQK